MKKLTKLEKENFDMMVECYKSQMYVGYNSKSVFNTYERLVEKGHAKVVKVHKFGKNISSDLTNRNWGQPPVSRNQPPGSDEIGY